MMCVRLAMLSRAHQAVRGRGLGGQKRELDETQGFGVTSVHMITEAQGMDETGEVWVRDWGCKGLRRGTGRGMGVLKEY